MAQDVSTFDAALEMVDRLSADDQRELMEIVRHRLRDRRRMALVGEIRQARAEFEQGQACEMTADQIINEALD